MKGLITLLLLVLTTLFENPLSAQHNYTYALEISTRFLGAQRCGSSDSWLHGDCHLEDGLTVGKDLTGGWHDCGDHIKFSHTAPYTASLLLINFIHYPTLYPDNYSPEYSAPPANGIPDILDEVKYETDFLIKSIINDTVYYQVGDSTDHSSFSDPVYQSEFLPVSQGGNPRNVYFINEGASNICGESSSALALMSIAYRDYDTAYSNLCLQKALEYYQIGNTNPMAIASTSNNGSAFYPAANWADDMAFAAISLYYASGQQQYLTDAVNFYNNPDFAVPSWQSLTTDNVNQIVNLELYKISKDNQYLTALENHLTDMYLSQTDCGYMHFADWGSLTYAANTAYLALSYYKITGDADAFAFGKSNIDFILGTHRNTDNTIPMNFSFLIAYPFNNGDYPKHPHHAAAFGYGADAWDMFSQEAQNPGTIPYHSELTGALVGGPKTSCGDYNDNIDDYVANEVCIYYNAGLINALALIDQITSVLELPHNNKTFKIFPNPASDFIFVEKIQSEKIKIFDFTGKLIIETTENKIDISKFATGIYIIKSINGTGRFIK